MGKFIIRLTGTGYKFDLKAGNGEIIARSEVYTSEASCLKGVETMRKYAASAVEDQTIDNFCRLKHPKFEVYLDKAGEYRFRLKARNGGIIAVSEGYQKKPSCLKGIDSIKKNAPTAKVVRPAVKTKKETAVKKAGNQAEIK